MTQTGISVVKKYPFDLGTLCKATGLQIYKRAKGGHELPLVWGQRVTIHAVAAGKGLGKKDA